MCAICQNGRNFFQGGSKENNLDIYGYIVFWRHPLSGESCTGDAKNFKFEKFQQNLDQKKK